MEMQDPQDTATLMDYIPGSDVQEKVCVKSVYEGLVAIAGAGSKLYRTNGKRASFMRFDLTAHSVFVGNTFIISNGTIKMPVLETASKRIDITGLPWLTEDEQKLNPVELFDRHWCSRPNGSEKFAFSNFPAKDIDEMTDDEIIQGDSRTESRIRLEAWVLCAALDGTLENYVTKQPGWVQGNWWWSPGTTHTDKPAADQLVIKTEWWQAHEGTVWKAVKSADSTRIVSTTGSTVAIVPQNVDAITTRAIQSVPQLMRLAKSLAREAFTLQRRAKCYDIDPTICEINRVVDFIESGYCR